jgi:hypothetical protein
MVMLKMTDFRIPLYPTRLADKSISYQVALKHPEGIQPDIDAVFFLLISLVCRQDHPHQCYPFSTAYGSS